jgi:serine/threonine protein kinase
MPGASAEDKQCRAQKKAELYVLDLPFVDDGNGTVGSLTRLSDWNIGGELGRGAYSAVLNARNRVNGRAEVVKVIQKDGYISQDDRRLIENEYKSLQKVSSHPNIVSLTGALQSHNRIYFFMELAKGKDLFDFMKVREQSKKLVLDEAVVKISSCVASALAYCHGHGVAHMDVKPENIMVQQDYTAKLIDFGCSCPRDDVHGQCVGTVPFVAPEVLCGSVCDGAPADVWSLGVVVLELRFGLRALSRALGLFDTMQPQALGSRLLTLFHEPSHGLDGIRRCLGIVTQFQGGKVLATMLHADPIQRPVAAALA